MSDKKITDLAASPGAAATDLHEVSNMTGVPVSQKQSNQQLATFMQTALDSLTTVSGKIALNADGSASFGSGNEVLGTSGDLTLGKLGGSDGQLFLKDAATGANQIVLNGSSGIASFANGLANVDATGKVASQALDINGGNASIDSGGNTILTTLGLADFNASIVAGGVLRLGGTAAAGQAIISDAIGTPTIQLNGATGSALFTGDVEITTIGNGPIISSPGGIRYRIVVDDAGLLSTVAA